MFEVVAVSPDGRWVATASWWPDASGTMIKIWEASSGCPVMELPAAKARFITGFSPDGRWLATALGRVDIEGADLSEKFHRLWRVGTWEEGGTIPTLGLPCWDQDLALEGQNEGSITITQISTGAPIGSPRQSRKGAFDRAAVATPIGLCPRLGRGKPNVIRLGPAANSPTTRRDGPRLGRPAGFFADPG